VLEAVSMLGRSGDKKIIVKTLAKLSDDLILE
jgi:hypothetical protein